ncbi:MAG: phage tail assembly chaperone [Bauldia sp.]|nr:phage tail assembly chaperone [Bauldia sp.]
MMAVGFGRLGLASHDFWAMTPRELAAAVEGAFGRAAAPPDRAMLERLMTRFPDRRDGYDAGTG